jgi:DNA polymerase-3 subunit beta
MEFSCTQENLNLGLSVVSHIANRSVNLPILGNVLIKADGQVLKMMATNLEVAVTCTVRGKIEKGGEFTVPSRLFADYVNLLPKERVDVVQEGQGLAVQCGQYRTKLAGLPASEFPLIPQLEAASRFRVKVADFRRAVGQVAFAVAPNESRPEISGVLFRFAAGPETATLTLVATDSYRLAERIVPLAAGSAAPNDPVTVIVPARTVSEVVRILGVFKEGAGAGAEMEIGVGDGQVVFTFDTVELTSRTIEGRYPDYRPLIPDRFATEVIMTKEDLSRAVKTSSLFSRSGLNDVHFRFAENKPIALSAANTQTGEHAVEIDGDVNGKDNSVTVNFKYFLDGVANIESEQVLMQLNDGLSACILRPVTDDGRSDYLYIVMPIRQ